MSLNETRVLVVGGAGFVGSNLVRRLVGQSAAGVVVVDNYLSSDPDNLSRDDRITMIEGSVNDVVAELDPNGFDLLFHLATYHGNQSSIADPLKDHEHNLLPTLMLAEAFKGSHRLRRFVYASAGCTVAEKTSDAPTATDESAPISAHHDSPYQISKVVGEFYLNYYWARHHLPGVKARFQNVYGPGEVLGAGRWRGTPATVWRNVVPTFVYRALKGLPLILHEEGRPSRDFTYVGDIVEGLLACAHRGESGEVYNLASGTETTIREIAEVIAANVDVPVRFETHPRRAWDQSGRRFGSTVKARDALGFVASTSLEDGIRETVRWTQDNMDRIERAIARHDHHMRTADAVPA